MNINKTYKEYLLNTDAIDFIQERLKINSKLSVLLSSKIDLKTGHIFTFFPSYIDEGKLVEFREGNILKVETSQVQYKNGMKIVPIPNTVDEMVNYIYKYLRKNHTNIVIIEDFLARPSYEYIKTSPFRKLLVDENVYYVLNKNDNKKLILEVLKKSSSRPEGIGIFTSLLDKKEIEKNCSDAELLSRAMESIRGIFIEAYDYEGYLIWEKEQKAIRL